MATKKAAGNAAPKSAVKRKTPVFIALYGHAKVRKTTACSTLQRTKWLASDQNCEPTLDILGRHPGAEMIDRVTSLTQAREKLQKYIADAEAGTLDFDTLVADSITQFSDWAQQEVAAATEQEYMGQNDKNNGWGWFNSKMSSFLDDLAILARYVNVIVILHSKEKADLKRGDMHGFSLPPQMQTKLGRLVNWILYQTKEEKIITEGEPAEDDDYGKVKTLRDGTKVKVEYIINTDKVGSWMAATPGELAGLKPEEPADMQAILEKAGYV